MRSPVRTAWAPRTIMLPAAWRKMWVSSAIGTGRASTSSAKGLPAPTGRELVGVSDEDDVRVWADGSQERDEQLEVGHRGLVDDQEVGVELFDGRALAGDPAEGGVDGRGVEAARLGHAAGGSAGRGDEQRPRRSARAAAAQIRRIVAVLPVPGPPVTIERREANAARTAAACSGAGTRSSAGGAPRWLRLPARRRARVTISARSRSSLRGLGAVGPDRRPRATCAAATSPCVGAADVDLDDDAGVGHLAEARGVRWLPSSSPARIASSATGRQVEPARSASLRTCSTPARARAG